jgi:hypothetical protein
MKFLVNRFLSLGGTRELAVVDSIESLLSNSKRCDLVSVCSGLGARRLLNDDTVFPMKGQIVVVRGHVDHFYCGGLRYVSLSFFLSHSLSLSLSHSLTLSLSLSLSLSPSLSLTLSLSLSLSNCILTLRGPVLHYSQIAASHSWWNGGKERMEHRCERDGDRRHSATL